MSVNQTCYHCKTTRDLTQFTRRKDGKYYRMCKSCNDKLHLGKNSGRKLKHTTTDRTCYKCQRFLPVEEFTRRATGTYFSACKECNKFGFSQTRRSRILNSEGSFTAQEFNDKLKLHNCCPMCKRLWKDIELPKNKKVPWTADHIIPVSKNGRNTIDNIQPLCFSCNSKKGDKILTRKEGKQ